MGPIGGWSRVSVSLCLACGLALTSAAQAQDQSQQQKPIYHKSNYHGPRGDPILYKTSPEYKAKEQAKIKGVDPTKIPAKKAYEWAADFTSAENYDGAAILLEKYLRTDPPHMKDFSARIMLMRAYAHLNEGSKLTTALDQENPASETESKILIRNTYDWFAPVLAKMRGATVACHFIHAVEHKSLPFTVPRSATPRQKKAGIDRGQVFEWLLVQRESQILTDAHRAQDATACLEQFQQTLTPGSPLSDEVQMRIKSLAP